MQILFLCVKQSTHFYRDQNCNWQILTTRCGHYRWTLPTYVASNHPDEASLVLGLGPQQASGSWHPVLCAHPLVGGTHRSPRKVLVPPFYVEGNWGLQTVACPRAEMLSPEGETSGSRNSLSPTRFLIPIPGGRGFTPHHPPSSNLLLVSLLSSGHLGFHLPRPPTLSSLVSASSHFCPFLLTSHPCRRPSSAWIRGDHSPNGVMLPTNPLDSNLPPLFPSRSQKTHPPETVIWSNNSSAYILGVFPVPLDVAFEALCLGSAPQPTVCQWLRSFPHSSMPQGFCSSLHREHFATFFSYPAFRIPFRCHPLSLQLGRCSQIPWETPSRPRSPWPLVICPFVCSSHQAVSF